MKRNKKYTTHLWEGDYQKLWHRLGKLWAKGELKLGKNDVLKTSRIKPALG